MKTRLAAFVFLIAAIAAAPLCASPPTVGHTRVSKSKRQIRLPRHHFRHFRRRATGFRVFVPSHESLVEQNVAIDRLGLERIEDDRELDALVERGQLVPILCNRYVQRARSLPQNRAVVRPWVNDMLQELGQSFYEEFGNPIQVNSAVRTMRVQRILRRWNHNAAPIHGESASSHMAGATIDLQRRGLTRQQIRFIELKLMYLRARDVVLVEEEFRQPCFHVMVLRNAPVPVESVAIDDIPGVN